MKVVAHEIANNQEMFTPDNDERSIKGVEQTMAITVIKSPSTTGKNVKKITQGIEEIFCQSNKLLLFLLLLLSR